MLVLTIEWFSQRVWQFCTCSCFAGNAFVISSSVSYKIKKKYIYIYNLYETYEMKCFIMRIERRMGARGNIYIRLQYKLGGMAWFRFCICKLSSWQTAVERWRYLLSREQENKLQALLNVRSHEAGEIYWVLQCGLAKLVWFGIPGFSCTRYSRQCYDVCCFCHLRDQCTVGRNSLVGIAARYGLHDPGSNRCRKEIFCTRSDVLLLPTQSPVRTMTIRNLSQS